MQLDVRNTIPVNPGFHISVAVVTSEPAQSYTVRDDACGGPWRLLGGILIWCRNHPDSLTVMYCDPNSDMYMELL